MDYKIKVFKEVATNKSFTKTAEKLFISQPAVSKTIKNLEDQYGKAFFERKGNYIELTPDGELFLRYADKLIDIYNELEDVFRHDENLPNIIKLGASSTIGQYIIPKLVASIKEDYPDLKINLICGNTEEIQRLVLSGQLDFGIVEGQNHSNRLQYSKFIEDELVLVTNAKNGKYPESIKIDIIKELPFVEREIGSGTLEVIKNALRKEKIYSRSIDSTLGSTESIKSFLTYSDHYAFLSIHAITQQLMVNKLRILDIVDFKINRWFYFVAKQGYRPTFKKKFQNLLLKHYNK